MTLLLIVLFIIAIIVLYAVWVRTWLKSKSWTQGFFAAIEPIEIFLYSKSETILFARLKVVVGLLLSALTSLGEINLTPLMPFVPDKYQFYVNAAVNLLPLAISVVGVLDEKLRNGTTKPIELVAVPDKVVAETPKLAEAVAMADATKVEAVAAVQEAKAA